MAEVIEGWRWITCFVGVLYRDWQRWPGEQLLVLGHTTTEGLARSDGLQRDLLLFGVQLCDFDLQTIYSFSQCMYSDGKCSSLDKEFPEDILCKFTEASELADDVGQAGIGDTFQLTADAGRNGVATHMPRLYIPCHQRHSGV